MKVESLRMYTGKGGGDNSGFFTTEDTEGTEEDRKLILSMTRYLSGLVLLAARQTKLVAVRARSLGPKTPSG